MIDNTNVENGMHFLQTVKEWKNIFDSLTDMITIHDDDFNIIYSNLSATEKLKLPISSSGKVKCYTYYHGSDCPPKDCASCQILKTKVPAVVEIFEPYLNKSIEIRAIPRSNGGKQIIGSIHIVRDITERKQREEQLEDSREKLRNLTSHLQNVREAERKSMAREIHDGLGQELAILKMKILRLKKEISVDQKNMHEMIDTISNRIDGTITTIQKIITELRPVLVDKFGLQAAIEWQVEEFQDRTGITCDVIVDNQLSSIDKEREVSIFRIYQEILTNIMRHADATRVTIRLNNMDGQLIILVKDNGIGINEAQLTDPKSFGIIGMHERASFLGGSLSIVGIKSKGTTIKLTIPVTFNIDK